MDTKKQISDTLETMLLTRGADRITVASLVKECGISRSLFYYYFKDVFDVMVYHMEGSLEKLVSDALSENEPEKSMIKFLSGLMARQKEISRILSSKYREQAEREMIKAAHRCAKALIEERFAPLPMSIERIRHLEKIASYIIFGFFMDNQSTANPDIEGFSRNLIGIFRWTLS